MVDKIKDGGSAFPHRRISHMSVVPSQQDNGPSTAAPVYEDAPGMMLRDWLAGQALPAIITATSRGEHLAGAARGLPESATIEQRMAADAYAVADAMLAASMPRDGAA